MKNGVRFLRITKIFSIVFAINSLSCSLNYAKEDNPESSTPEFIFNNARFSKIEKRKLKMKMEAEKIEQYKSDSFSFAKNSVFKTFNENGNEETSGKCDLVSADTNNERYMLFGNINMNLIEQEMEIFADSLNFDKKNEQITSGTEQTVKIIKKDTEITGIGFSASGVSKKFTFNKNVIGTIETDDENNNNTNENDSETQNENSDE